MRIHAEKGIWGALPSHAATAARPLALSVEKDSFFPTSVRFQGESSPKLPKSRKKKMLLDLYETSGFKAKLSGMGFFLPIEKHPLTQALLQHPSNAESFYKTVVEDITSVLVSMKYLMRRYQNQADPNQEKIVLDDEATLALLEKNIQNLFQAAIPNILASIDTEKQWKLSITAVTEPIWTSKGSLKNFPRAMATSLVRSTWVCDVFSSQSPSYKDVVEKFLDYNLDSIHFLSTSPLAAKQAEQISPERWNALRDTLNLLEKEITPPHMGVSAQLFRKAVQWFMGSNSAKLRKYNNLALLVEFVGLQISDQRWLTLQARLNREIRAGKNPFRVMKAFIQKPR